MARVRVYEGGQIQSQGTTTERLRPADFSASVGPGLEALGRATAQAADARVQIAERQAEDHARELDIQHMQRAAELRQGVYSSRGSAAPAAVNDANRQLRDYNSELLGNAPTPLARQLLRRSIETRTLQESEMWSDYARGQEREAGDNAVASRASGFRESALDQPLASEAAASNLAAGEQEIRNLGTRQGWDEATTAQRLAEYRSGYHSARVNQLFQADDPVAAQAYLDAHRGEISAQDEATAHSMIIPALRQIEAQSDAAAIEHDIAGTPPSTTQSAGAHPTSFDRMVSITMHVGEGTGGRDRNRDGNLITSPAGAQGRMQVMPATAANPGYGIRPSNGTDEDRARVGRELLAALLRRYNGDAAKAWAAYNWDSSGTMVDRLVARYGDDWLAHAPAETRGYVTRNVAALNGERPQAPDGRHLDVSAGLAAIERRVASGEWTTARGARAREAFLDSVRMNDAVRDRSEDDARRAINTALDQIAANGGRLTSLSQLPADALRNAPPGMIEQLQQTIRASLNASPPSNSTLANQLIVMAADDPNGFLRLSPETFRGRISNDEVQWIVRTQTEIRNRAGPQPSEILSVIRWALPQSPLAVSGIANSGANARERAAANNAAHQQYLRGLEARLLPAVQARLRATHGQAVITQQDILNAVQAEMTIVRAPDGSNVPLFHAREQGAQTYGVTIPPQAVPLIDQALRNSGLPITPNNRANLYLNRQRDIDAAIR